MVKSRLVPPHRDCLQIGRHLAEARAGKDVIQAVEDRVDSGELIEHGNGNRQEQREPVPSGEQSLLGLLLFQLGGCVHRVQLGVDVLLADRFEDGACFLGASFAREPARTPRNLKQHQEEECRGHGRNAQLPTPLVCTPLQRKTDRVVGKIRQQDSSHHVELEETHQTAAPSGWSDLGDVHRPQDGRTADREPADEAKEDEDVTSWWRRHNRAPRRGKGSPSHASCHGVRSGLRECWPVTPQLRSTGRDGDGQAPASGG
jgi:hypothetical protein